MNKEPVPSASLLVVQGHPQLGLTLTANIRVTLAHSISKVSSLPSANKGKVNLSLDELKVSIEVILAPASNPAPGASAILECVRELVHRGRKAGSVDIGVAQVDVLVHKEDGQVIAESGVAHEGVLQDPGDCVFLMSEGFWGIESTGIIFSNSHFQEAEIK